MTIEHPIHRGGRHCGADLLLHGLLDLVHMEHSTGLRLGGKRRQKLGLLLLVQMLMENIHSLWIEIA